MYTYASLNSLTVKLPKQPSWRLKAEKSGKNFKADITTDLLRDDFLANRDLRHWEMEDVIDNAWREKVHAVHRWTVIDTEMNTF